MSCGVPSVPFPSSFLPYASLFPFTPSFPSPFSLISSPSIRLNPARGSGERCKLPQQVRTEPGSQTHFRAFRGQRRI